MEVASKFDISIDHVLERYSAEIERFYEHQDQINKGRHYNFRYFKIAYELKRGRMNKALDEILCCMDLADLC